MKCIATPREPVTGGAPSRAVYLSATYYNGHLPRRTIPSRESNLIRILGVNRFPARIFWSCTALAIVAVLVPRWLILPIVAGGAL